MTKFLFPVFDYIENNKWVQYVLIGFVIIASLGSYLLIRDAGVRRRERERAEAKTIQVVNKIEKESSSDADQASAARDNAPRVSSADGVPKSTADRIFRD